MLSRRPVCKRTLAGHNRTISKAQDLTLNPKDNRRRQLLKLSGGLLAFQMDGITRWLSPRQARAQALRHNILSAEEVRCLEALGDTLLPGAAAAGLAHYIDHQLQEDAEQSLLVVRYFDIPPPYTAFYRQGLAALDRFALDARGSTFAALGNEARTALVRHLAGNNPEQWQGVPAPLFYFILRLDAVDVMYGTVEGFDRLGVPYMPHIAPPRPW